MNNEYYGVSESSTALCHYGVKGMKWGVRKAIEKGNAKAYGRHYARASRKLDRLNKKADIATQKRIARNSNTAAKVALGIGVLGTGGAVGANAVGKSILGRLLQKSKANDAVNIWSYRNKMMNALYADDTDTYNSMYNAQNKALDEYIDAKYETNSKMPKVNTAKAISGGIGAAGLATAAGLKARSIVAKSRTTPKGHAKAVAKRDAFKKEMIQTFNDPAAAELTKKAQSKIYKEANASVQRLLKNDLKNQKFEASEKARKSTPRYKNKLNKYKTKAENWSNTAKEMKYWENKTVSNNPKYKKQEPTRGEALYSYRTLRKRAEQNADRYKKKYQSML